MHQRATVRNQPTSKSRVKTLRAAMMLVVLVLAAVPALTMDLNHNAFSSADNRSKAGAPTWNFEESDPALAFKEYAAETDACLSDRIGFRSNLIAAYSVLNDRVFNVMTHPLYEYGKDGYVFFRFDNDEVSDDYLTAFVVYVKAMQDYCQQRGIAFLYALSPEKARVYSEKIPDTVREVPNTAARLKRLFDAYGVSYIDQGEALLSAKKDGKEVFNKVYDAGHWNSEGMYAGAQSILNQLQEMGFPVEDLDLAAYTKEYTLQNEMPASNYPIDENTFKYYLTDPATGTTELEGYTTELAMDQAHQTAWYYENANHPNDISVLMFQGSYYNTQGTMLHNQFDRFAMVHNYQNIFALPYYVDVFEPDLVIFENADYTFQEQYFKSDYMHSAHLPETLESVSGLPIANISEGPAALFDSAADIANFAIDASAMEGMTDKESAVYVIVGNRTLDTVSNGNGVFWLGIKTEELRNQDTATVIVIGNSRQYWFTCSLKSNLAMEGTAEETASSDLIDPNSWLGGSRSVPFHRITLK